MTRKDYTLIADSIIKQYTIIAENYKAAANIDLLILPFVETLSTNNSSFDTTKFIKYIKQKIPLKQNAN
jgi:hypothetical protein